MKQRQRGFILFELIFVLVFVLSVVGWGLNLYKVTQVPNFNNLTPLVVLRIVGVPAIPLGVVLGFVP